MNNVSNELLVKALSQVEYAEKALALWETLSNTYNQMPSNIKEAFIVVKNFLIEKELGTYRNLFMLTTVFENKEIREKAKKLALKRYLSNDMAIMHMWSHNGEVPGTWLEADEQLLRNCFAEIECEITGKRKYTKKNKK